MCVPYLLRFLDSKIMPSAGEVGKEMYIVKSGYLDVIGFDNAKVLATLSGSTLPIKFCLLHIPYVEFSSE